MRLLLRGSSHCCDVQISQLVLRGDNHHLYVPFALMSKGESHVKNLGGERTCVELCT